MYSRIRSRPVTWPRSIPISWPGSKQVWITGGSPEPCAGGLLNRRFRICRDLLSGPFRRRHHVLQGGLGFRPAACLEAAIRIHPQVPGRDETDGLFKKRKHFFPAGYPGGVNIVNARSDLVRITEARESFQPFQ